MRTTINRIGKYELKAVLARMPLSTVYDGWDSDIARRVAIKLIPLSSVDDSEAGESFARFKRGAQAAGQLNHPNIVGVYDYGETDDYAYLVMEFVNGTTLKALFDDNRRFALPEICRIIGAVLGALQYSHDRGVVHRDVKPANIMFTAENQVKLTDFGIARLEDSEMTQAGMVIGTPAYMSPEQFLGEKIDWRTDIYSTGVVLYHILTGARPYEGNLATIMHKVLYGSPLLPSTVSTSVTPALDAVVTRAMARKPEDRFGSAAEFNAALQAAGTAARPHLDGIAAGAGQPPDRFLRSISGVVKSSARPRTFVALAASVLVAVGAVGAVGWYGGSKPSPPPTPSLAAPPLAAPPSVEPAAEPLTPDQARLQYEQDQTWLKKKLEQVRLQQEQARLQQEQEQARVRQEQDQVRVQQEQEQEQARLQLARDQARQKQEQEQARLQLVRDQARQKQEQEQARQKLAPDQARQRQDPDQTRQTQEQEQARQKLAQDQARQKQDSDGPSVGSILPNLYPVTSTSGAVGLVCESITVGSAGKFGLDRPQGMVVTGVLAGGAAAKAGIQERDVILKIKGSEVHDLSVLARIAAGNPAGQTVPVDIMRHGDHKVLQLVVSPSAR